MSNIEPDIIDPGRTPSPSVIVPTIDPDGDLVGSDDIREPDDDAAAVEPDPEESGKDLPNIRRA